MKPGKGRLKGVEIRIYQGADRSWHAAVLLDPHVWGNDIDRLPRRGNRPRVDSGSGRWWYDPSASIHAWGRKRHPFGTGGLERDSDTMLEVVRAEVASILRDLLTADVSDDKIIRSVEAIPARANPRLRGVS